MPRLLYPGILLLNLMRYPQKFGLISLLMAVPLAVTIGLLLSETQPRIEFTERELLGSAYVRQLGSLFDVVQQSHDFAHVNDMVRLANIQASITQAVSELRRESRYTQAFGTESTLQTIADHHDQLRAAIAAGSEEQISHSHVQLLEAIYNEIGRVGDASNLILDPELTTYYLMSIAVIQTPQQLILLTEADHLLEEARLAPTNANTAELISLAGQLDGSAAETRRAVEIAAANDSLLGAELTAQLSNSLTSLSALSNTLRSIDAQSSLSPTKSIQLSNQASEASKLLSRTALTALDLRLQQRVDRLMQKNWLAFSIAGVLLCLLIYLLLSFYVAIMQAIQVLDRSSQQLRDGDSAHPVALKTRDELGQIVTSFNRVIAALADESSKRQVAVEQQTKLQEEIIQTQLATLDDLAVPLIPLTEQVALLPLVGSIDARRAQQILRILLQGVAAIQSRVVIMDMSGVRVVDTQVAQLLIQAASGARLLGAHVVLSGLTAEVSQTIVHLGVDFGSIGFHATLQEALAAHINSNQLSHITSWREE